MHCQVMHSIDLIPNVPLPDGKYTSACSYKMRKSNSKFNNYLKNETSGQALLLVEVQSCWCKRNMGHGDSILITDPLTKSQSEIGTRSHELMTSSTNSREPSSLGK